MQPSVAHAAHASPQPLSCALGQTCIPTTVALLLSLGHVLAAQPAAKRALTFTVDTTTYGNVVESSLSSLWLKVSYDGQRGRIDVVERVRRPSVRLGWLLLSPPELGPGDYFLFDSSRFVHVRPHRRAFTVYPLRDVAYNFEDRRDRWPFFRRHPGEAAVARRTATEGRRVDVGSYWHSEWVRDTSCWGAAFGQCLVRGLARGRGEASDVPPGLISLIRWIGPTMSLGAIAGRDTLLGRPIRATMINQWTAFGGDSVVTITTARFATGVRLETVHDTVFQLPRGFRQLRPPGR
jgi:hypothetical protein